MPESPDIAALLAWTRDAIAAVKAAASLGTCPDWGHCTPDCHHDERDGIDPQAAERQAQVALRRCALDRELLDLHGGNMHSCPAKDDTGYLDEWTQFGYSDTCPVVQGIAEAYGWTDARQKAPFKRMAEILLRSLRDALTADQTDFVLAPSPDGDDLSNLARIRAQLGAARDQAARNARDAHSEHVQLVNEGVVAGLDNAIRLLDATPHPDPSPTSPPAADPSPGAP